MFDIWEREPTRRRRKKPGRIRHDKGVSYEKRCKKFLRKKGLKIIKHDFRVSGAQIDYLVYDKSGRPLAVELKNLKPPIGPPVVKKLKWIIERSKGHLKGGIIIARKGATAEAKRQAGRGKIKIKIYKYAGARKQAETKLPPLFRW